MIQYDLGVNPAELLSALVNVVWMVATFLQVILLLRLWQQGLLGVYRWFGVYLAVSVAQALVSSMGRGGPGRLLSVVA